MKSSSQGKMRNLHKAIIASSLQTNVLSKVLHDKSKTNQLKTAICVLRGKRCSLGNFTIKNIHIRCVGQRDNTYLLELSHCHPMFNRKRGLREGLQDSCDVYVPCISLPHLSVPFSLKALKPAHFKKEYKKIMIIIIIKKSWQYLDIFKVRTD